MSPPPGERDRPRPRRAVADAEIDLVEVRVVDDGVPDRPAAADLPPLAALPCVGGVFHFRVFERQGRIARHREEAPDLLARRGVVRGDVAPHAILGPAVADEHLTPRRPRCAGNGIGALPVHERVDFPHERAGSRVESDQASVEAAHVHAALVDRDPAVDDVAARPPRPLAGHLGIVGPDLLTRNGIDGVHTAPRAREEHDAVDDDRRRLEAAVGAQVAVPGQPQFPDVLTVDVRQGGEALFFEGAPMGQPVARLAVGVDDAGIVDQTDRRFRYRRRGRLLGRGRGDIGLGLGRLPPVEDIGQNRHHDGDDREDHSTHGIAPQDSAWR